MLKNWMRRFHEYAAHPDPRTALANFVALLIVSNQPFYPLYIVWIAGRPGWITLLTFLSAPFFFAVPAVARRNSALGRVLLCVAGTLNTLLAVWLLGVASGVGLLYLPCLLIGTTLFAPSEKAAMAICVALPAAAYFSIDGPADVFTAGQYAALVKLHAVSAGALIVLIGYRLTAAFAAKSKLPT
jgi:hypothetical protein